MPEIKNMLEPRPEHLFQAREILDHYDGMGEVIPDAGLQALNALIKWQADDDTMSKLRAIKKVLREYQQLFPD